MITLYKFGSIGDVADASPFCAKVEAYLKMANLPYEVKASAMNLRKAPKGKLPYIVDDGKTIADSSFIIKYLNDKTGNSVDGHLSVEEKAISHAFIKMIDENLYWVLLHGRWKLDHNIETLNSEFFGSIPFPLNKIIASKARKDALLALHKHGMGRHTDEEICEIGNSDLLALSNFLGNKNFFFGDKPSTLDATAYAILAQMIRVNSFKAPAFDKAKTYQNLVDFTNRFHDKYFK
jgi:glutathione S-transferase